MLLAACAARPHYSGPGLHSLSTKETARVEAAAARLNGDVSQVDVRVEEDMLTLTTADSFFRGGFTYDVIRLRRVSGALEPLSTFGGIAHFGRVGLTGEPGRHVYRPAFWRAIPR